MAERYLAGAARRAGLQVTAHRPTKATTTTVDDVPADKLTETEDALVRSFLHFSLRLGVRPDFAHLGSTFHIAPLEDVASAIATAATVSQETTGSDVKALLILEYPGMATVRADMAAAYVEELFRQPGHRAVRELPAVPVLHWVGLVKRAGLFEWFFTLQELVVTDDAGRRVLSRW